MPVSRCATRAAGAPAPVELGPSQIIFFHKTHQQVTFERLKPVRGQSVQYGRNSRFGTSMRSPLARGQYMLSEALQ